MNMSTRLAGTENGYTWPIRVYYEDTDAGGIVFYANYLKFFERARTEWLRACGVDQNRLAEETGAIFIVRSTAVDYRAPARLDDVITVISRIDRLGRASVDFGQEAWRGGTLLATGSIRVGCVDRLTLRPAGIPPHVLEALRRGPGGDQGDETEKVVTSGGKDGESGGEHGGGEPGERGVSTDCG